VPVDLETEALGFAEELSALFRHVLPYETPEFQPQSVRREGRFQIGPRLDPDLSRFDSRFFSHIPLRARGEDRGAEWLSLRPNYTVELDDQGEHLQVSRSTMGL
jgi:hypothetical protein